VQPVHRADPSGTTFLFVDYLAKVRPSLRETLGVSNIPNWPAGVGIAQPKSDGVAGHISRTPGAVGYIELSFALENPELKIGTLRNRAGRFVVPNAKRRHKSWCHRRRNPTTSPR
jgi:phosphate transport system substrate-binding protein